MKNRYLKALITSLLSIAPIILIVCIISWTPLLSLYKNDYIMLIIGGVILIVGLALFQIGAATGLTKVGEYMGSSLSKQENLFIVIVFSLALGALITCAEPSILIVSKQVTIVKDNQALNAILLIGSIAIGVGIFVVIGVLRIIFHKSLKVWYLFFYMITFMLICLIAIDPNKVKLLPFIFDSGGVTTGSATVPFILALGAGVAIVRGGRTARSDSFGLVGMASIGPIITMTICILIKSSIPDYEPAPVENFNSNFANYFISTLFPNRGQLGSLIEVGIALSPILVIFFIYNKLFIKLPKARILSLLIGFGYSFIGLSLFLSSTTAVMRPMGDIVGRAIGAYWQEKAWIIILFAFAIGLVTILCEPAVHVLTTQMETISSGQIKKRTVLLTLSLGVGVAIMLAAIRAIYNFSILYYIIPGYIISLLLMVVCPDIFTAMAFDSGGTASGPMSTSFVLPMIIGIYFQVGNDKHDMDSAYDLSYYGEAFGVVALIALTPIIAIQMLGVALEFKQLRRRIAAKKAIAEVDDVQVIHFIKGA
ncbi:MAG: DUF1538 domain-containing protein [Bacilli bacterium]|nr:DUF1538 domain-containing protein [Bacilli bacterium]